MIAVWKQFLMEQGAQWDNHRCSSFGDYFTEVAPNAITPSLTDISDMGVLKVWGSDAKRFLQGQLSCDMEAISPHQGHLAVHCDPQGRVIATLLIYEREQEYFLLIPMDTLTATKTSLSRYALFSQVTLTDMSNENTYVRIGFWGNEAYDYLKKYCDAVPQVQYGVCSGKDYTIMSLPGLKERFLIVGSLSWMKNLWCKLSKQATPVSTMAWILEDIRLGIPHIPSYYTKTFTPHALNFHLINGISFTKGCYTGQEIIARMHYLGKAKQRVFRILVQGAMKCTEGIMLVYSDDVPVGNVLQLCEIKKNVYEGLAVLYTNASKDPHLVIEEYLNVSISVLPLPYEKA